MEINDFDKLGIEDVKKVYYNPDYETLFKKELEQQEGVETNLGAVAVDTGIFTGRSPKDKYFVKQPPSEKYIAWGDINQPISKEIFDELFEKTKEYLSGKELYVMDAFAGASDESKKGIRVVTEIAWQAHFVKNMFIRPTEEELKNFHPDFTLYVAANLKNDRYKEHGRPCSL